jgi:phosphoenolpyruvate carboxykinase (ATP)
MSLKATRACIDAIMDGSILQSEFDTTDLFGLHFPVTLPGVDSKVLNPKNAWEDKEAYLQTREKLARMFVENFKKYLKDDADFDYSVAGPQL